MKRTRIHTILFFCMLSACVCAQSESDSALINLPPIDVLIESAMLHSPLLKAKEKQVDIDGEEHKIQKRKWMNYVFIEGAANYGKYDQVLLQDHTSEDNSSNYGLLNRGEQTRYYGGVGIKLPFSSLTNRKRQLQKRKLKQEQSDLEMQDVRQQLKHMVIDAYYQLQYLDESMRTYNRIYQTLEIGYLKAEKDLLNGRTNLNEFALLASTVGKAKDDYDKARHTFYAHYYRLKDLTGLEF